MFSHEDKTIISGGTYQVIGENLDITPMNKEKEKYNKFVNLYKQKCFYLFISLETLKELRNNEKSQALGKISPAFLSMTIKNIWVSSVVTLSAFFSNDTMSINKYFNYIKANHDKIFTGKFQDRVVNGLGVGKDEIMVVKFDKTILEVVAECEAILEENKANIDKIITLRDKIFAHFDKDTENYEELLKDININLLLKLVQIIETITNNINLQYDRIYTCFSPTNSNDIKSTLSALNFYSIYRKEIFELRKKTKH